jgi:outer membrane lipoprotein-sorting protein
MRLFTILLALFFSTVSIAQTDAKAITILDNMAYKYKAYKGVDIAFSLTMENAQEDIKETSKGNARVKGNKYKINIMGVETYYDGTNMWSYMVDAEEVNLTTPDPEDESTFDPSKLFTTYQDGYKIKYVREVFQHNRALHIIDLFPKDVKGSEFSRIKLKVDKDKNTIYQMIRYGKDGNDYTITLSKISENKTLTDAMFKFNKAKHPDVEIIDLRD